MANVYSRFEHKKRSGQKCFALLIDPDKNDEGKLYQTIVAAEKASVDCFFIGSSMLMHGGFEQTVTLIRQQSRIPVVVFPGNRFQLSDSANAILLLSLISGRNADLLIGQHVMAAPELKRSGIEIIPTGYMLIDGGSLTSVNYVSQTIPIPHNKPDIAVATAMAGEMLGLKMIYLEAGSGAQMPVSEEMIQAVRRNIHLPLIVGGGIRDGEQAFRSCKAGADVIVVGNGFEEDAGLIFEISNAVKQASKSDSSKTSAI